MNLQDLLQEREMGEMGEMGQLNPIELKDPIETIEIQPIPGFVVKTKLEKPNGDYPVNLKVFVNICHSHLVPAPPTIPREELDRVLKSGDGSSYRIPLSLTGPKSDIDKNGSVCLVFETCFNSTVLENSDADFRLFVMALAVEWIEEKHSLVLSREFSLPKLKAKGVLGKHLIRKKARPIIADVTCPEPVKTPTYEILREPLDDPDFVVVVIQLPELDTIKEAQLDIEESRVILNSARYKLDLTLDHLIDIDSAAAQFDRSTSCLSVTSAVIKVLS